MNALGIDYGEKRVGLSFGDALGLAVPIPAAVESSESARLDHIQTVIKDRRIDHLVVGLPYNMDGSSGFKAKEVEVFIEILKIRFQLPVSTVDERLTSHQVEQQLKAQKRKVDRRSGEVDSRAATLILQDYLDQKFGQNLGLPRDEGES
ncbi:MAG: Holliday junction resolvase RuvX [Verrucomicrobia bacterium]|nr:Holliday junction resolvase RuvX [Verrucomicrobiota bacterium]